MTFDNISNFNYQPDTSDNANEFPRMYWRNGVKAAMTCGEFYIKAAEVNNQELGTPWISAERHIDEPAYVTPGLKIMVIRKRSQAYIETTTDGLRLKTWQEHYKANAGMKIYTELLCYIEGYSEPVTWVIKGLTGKAVTGKNVGIVDKFHEAVIKEAQKSWKNGTVPPWAFWTPITSAKDSKGRPVFTDTGYGSHVTPPTLGIIPAGREGLKSLWVGEDLLRIGLALYNDTAEWQKAKRSSEGAPQEKTTQAPPAAPQSDDDSIF